MIPKFLGFILLFLAGCGLRREHPSTPSRKGYFSQQREGNSTIEHPESPLVLSPDTPAWEIGLWLCALIILVCVAPAVARYLHAKWPIFHDWSSKKLKTLTKRKK